jgi:radical SAM protein with 4Fe4S-binding SPASM domain
VALGVDTHVKTPTMSINENQLGEYIDFATGLGATYAFDPGQLMPREGGDRTPEAWSRSAVTHKRMLRDPVLTSTPPAPRAQKPLSATLCGAGENVHVEPNGELRPCTMLSVPLGNVTADGGIRAARGENATLREMLALRWSDVHGCRECDLRAYCGRCHAAALAEVGDALAPYSSACANARDQYEVAIGTPARISAPAGRDARLGPYRMLVEHTYVAIDDAVTAADDGLVARLGWVRKPDGGRAAPVGVRPGELVQIRRPGRDRAKLMLIPGGDEAATTAEQDHAVRTSWAAPAHEATT